MRGKVIRCCNALEYVKVSVADADGKEVANMKVELKFTGETDQGKFDCIGIYDAVGNNARYNRQGKLKDAMDRKVIETVMSCSSKDVTGSCPNDECLYQLGYCIK
ncbi:hypothetical protein EJ02DRAFT_420876 [Clathrospora elynae]|uniref:Uncharacterized protein n=1 Tax=Clathrospora elynae TaxID=706981 RepID=A0A6A5STD6_9PLEO|nr:hypothetical protein EJ02DRAFT_420876 [Clathrospora elynae]